jgi:hypothetical protein
MAEVGPMDHPIVYVAVIADRHADPQVRVFSTEDEAVGYARGCAHAYAYRESDVDERDVAGYVYDAAYSESDRVSVVACRVDGAVIADWCDPTHHYHANPHRGCILR